MPTFKSVNFDPFGSTSDEITEAPQETARFTPIQGNPFADEAPGVTGGGGRFRGAGSSGGTFEGDQEFRESSLLDVGKSAIKSFKPALLKAGGALLREQELFPERRIPETVRQFAPDLDEIVRAGTIKTDKGEKIANYWNDKLQEVQPKLERGSPKFYAHGILQSIVQNVPWLGIGLLTKGSSPALLGFGLQAKGTKFQDLIEEGIDPEQASAVSSIVGFSEALTEKLPIDQLVKKGLPFVKRVLTTAAVDVPGELINTTVEDALDKVTIRPNMTLSDFVEDLTDTAIISLGSAAGLSTIAQPFAGGQPGAADQDIIDTPAEDVTVQGDVQPEAIQEPIREEPTDSTFTPVEGDPFKVEGVTAPLTDIQDTAVAELIRKNPDMSMNQARDTVLTAGPEIIERQRAEKENVRISELESSLVDLKAKFDARRVGAEPIAEAPILPEPPSKEVVKPEIAEKPPVPAVVEATKELTPEATIGKSTLQATADALAEGDLSVIPDIQAGVQEHGIETMQDRIRNLVEARILDKVSVEAGKPYTELTSEEFGKIHKEVQSKFEGIKSEVDKALEDEVTVIKPERPKTAFKFDQDKHSLGQFVKGIGGINYNKEALKGELDQLKEQGGAKFIINKQGRGLTLDEIAEQAKEVGFLEENEGPNELLDKLNSDFTFKTTGGRVYSKFREAEIVEPVEETELGALISDENLKTGDRIKIEDEWYELKGLNDEGNMLLQDGQVIEVDPFAEIRRPVTDIDKKEKPITKEVKKKPLSKEAFTLKTQEGRQVKAREPKQTAGLFTKKEFEEKLKPSQVEKSEPVERLKGEQKLPIDKEEFISKAKKPIPTKISFKPEKIEVKVTPEQIAKREAELKAEGKIETKRATPEKRIVSREAFDKAQASLKSKLTGLKAGIDPTAIKELAIIGAYHIESGLRNFKSWSDRMVSEYGDKVKPHLKRVWNDSKKIITSEKIKTEKTEAVEKAKGRAEEKISDIKTTKDILDRRRALVRATRDQFNLTDSDLKKITRRDIRLMSNFEFKQFMDELRIKAALFEEKLQAKAELIDLINRQNFKKWNNLREAYKLPPVGKMSTEQINKMQDLLSGYVENDEFLSTRKLELVDKTELKGIKTIREARQKLAEELNIPITELDKIKTTELDRLKYDTALAATNPFYNLLVTDTIRNDLEAASNYLDVEEDINRLAKAARKSRKRTAGDILVPQDKIVFEYIEADPAKKSTLAGHMTKEELDYAHYVIQKGNEALTYLMEEGVLENTRFKDAYIVHIRQGLLESIKDTGLKRGFQNLFEKYRQDEQVFNILDSNTGDVLPLEKFFKFSLFRSGEIKPSKNVAKSFLAYWRSLEKKKALDKLIPKMDIYVRALETEQKTPKGLKLDISLKRFFNEWMNTKKGRHVKLIAKQGGNLDLSLRALNNLVTLKDLALNIPVGAASAVGEATMNQIMLGKKRHFLGLVRKNTIKGKRAINYVREKLGNEPIDIFPLGEFKNFTGKGVWEELSEASNDIGDQLSGISFAMFHRATTEANKTFLLGSLTKQEYDSGIVAPERLAGLKKAMGEYRHVEGSKSIIGSTPEGGVMTKYKSWAIPPMTSTLRNFRALANKKLDAKGAWQLYRSLEITIFVLMVGSLISSDDDTFVGALRRKLYREALSLTGSLNPKFWLAQPRLASWLHDIADAVGTILEFEKYKTKDEFKGVSKLKRQLIPRAITQFDTKDESIKSLASQYVKARDAGNKKRMSEIEKEIDDLNKEREKFIKDKHTERLAGMSESDKKKFIEDKQVDIEERADNIIQDDLRDQYSLEGNITDEFNIKKMAAMPVKDFNRLRDTYSSRTQRKLNAKVGAWRGTIKPETEKKNKVRDFFLKGK